MTQSEMVDFINGNVDVDLSFVFADSEVPISWQCKLVQASFKTLKRFAGMGESRAKMRVVLTELFGAQPGGRRAHQRGL